MMPSRSSPILFPPGRALLEVLSFRSPYLFASPPLFFSFPCPGVPSFFVFVCCCSVSFCVSCVVLLGPCFCFFFWAPRSFLFGFGVVALSPSGGFPSFCPSSCLRFLLASWTSCSSRQGGRGRRILQYVFVLSFTLPGYCTWNRLT